MTKTEPDQDRADARVLLVDDEPANLGVLRGLLEAEGYRVALAPSGEVALRNAARLLPDLVLLDVVMPQMDGYEVCRRLRADARTAEVPVVFVTVRDDDQGVLTGFAAGGVDYITKPFREGEVLARVRTHVRLHRLAAELARRNTELEQQLVRSERLSGRLSLHTQRETAYWGLGAFVGQSPTVQRIFEEVRLLQGNPLTSVLITGESGTGKELVARAIHFGSPLHDGPFVPVNCAALPAELAESLLFGHVRGAFTGADADRAGYFEMGHGGTLFLDEVGEMPQTLQAKLLRVLEDGEVWRVGAREARRVETRVMAATNADLRERISTGRFRPDLYYRLAHFLVEVPTLRERPEDIPLLAGHFARLFATEMGREPPALSDEVLRDLVAHTFPGNVRELKNLIERAVIESEGRPIEPWHLHFLAVGPREPATAAAPPPSGCALPLNIDQAIAEAERWVVARAVAQMGGNVSAAARLLGTNRNRVYRILGQARPSATGPLLADGSA